MSRALPSDRATRQSPSPSVSALRASIPSAGDFDLSAMMRLYGIRNIWRDPLLDRFSVTLLDYSSGQGGSVGEALADAEGRAA